ncbi:GGDEF domain-containing protein [Sphingomonas sp.]|uniref:GGDEF domain-containing protein n=1 Tax=Sphingomonas sp. TaxID=28214 RepID=UPI003AFF728F
MDDGTGLIARIQTLMNEGGLEPSPSNYEFLYRYATGADPQLVEAVDVVRETKGVLRAAAISAIRRDLYGMGSSGVGRLIEDTERQLSRMTDVVERSDEGTRSYVDTLQRNSVDTASTLELQRAMLADIAEATAKMIAHTEQLQEDLSHSVREIEALKTDLEIARVESRSDALTGLSNRKACCDYLDAQIARARSDGSPLSLIFVDIDHFKQFNDNYGHRVGDEVLRLVAQSLERAFHGRGFVARWGGEEFVIVMPNHRAEEAAEHADGFRRLISSRVVRTRQSAKDIGRITLSLGVAQLGPSGGAQQLVDQADRALYDAKADGRDRVVTWKNAA